jgi:hypothetical protein
MTNKRTKEMSDIISALTIAWAKYPEWRLGQLIFNLTNQYDCFHVQDEELIKALENFNKQI